MESPKQSLKSYNLNPTYSSLVQQSNKTNVPIDKELIKKLLILIKRINDIADYLKSINESTINQEGIIDDFNKIINLLNIYSLTTDFDNSLIFNTIKIRVMLEEKINNSTIKNRDKLLKKLYSAWGSAFKLRDLPNEIFELVSLKLWYNKSFTPKKEDDKWDLFGLFTKRTATKDFAKLISEKNKAKKKKDVKKRIDKLMNSLKEKNILTEPISKVNDINELLETTIVYLTTEEIDEFGDDLIKIRNTKKVSNLKKIKGEDLITEAFNEIVKKLITIDVVLAELIKINLIKNRLNKSLLIDINHVINEKSKWIKSCIAIEKVHKEIIKELE